MLPAAMIAKPSHMTEPSFRLIAPQANRSFIFKWEPLDLHNRWHYHPEVEIIYFIEGKANAVIGEGFQYFEEGDLILLGANFPHVLQENREFARQHPDCTPFGLVIQFNEDFLGADFLQKPELQAIDTLLKNRAGACASVNLLPCARAIIFCLCTG